MNIVKSSMIKNSQTPFTSTANYVKSLDSVAYNKSVPSYTKSLERDSQKKESLLSRILKSIRKSNDTSSLSEIEEHTQQLNSRFKSL